MIRRLKGFWILYILGTKRVAGWREARKSRESTSPKPLDFQRRGVRSPLKPFSETEEISYPIPILGRIHQPLDIAHKPTVVWMGQELFDLFQERALHTGTLADPADRSKGRSLSPTSICTKKGVSYKGLERRLLPYFRWVSAYLFGRRRTMKRQKGANDANQLDKDIQIWKR